MFDNFPQDDLAREPEEKLEADVTTSNVGLFIIIGLLLLILIFCIVFCVIRYIQPFLLLQHHSRRRRKSRESKSPKHPELDGKGAFTKVETKVPPPFLSGLLWSEKPVINPLDNSMTLSRIQRAMSEVSVLCGSFIWRPQTQCRNVWWCELFLKIPSRPLPEVIGCLSLKLFWCK